MSVQTRIITTTNQFTLFFFLFIGGLAASRILYEWLFPHWLWLGHPFGAFPFAAMIAVIGWLIFTKYLHEKSLYLSPLALNFIYLGQAQVDIVESRLIFFASIWLTLLLCLFHKLPKHPETGFLLVLMALLPIYLLTISHQVGRDDTFEFQVVTPHLGIVHPTGYPLYLLLGRLFTLVPFGSVAWRLNMASVVYVTIGACWLYWLLYRWWQRPLPAVLTAVFIPLSPTLWSQAIIAEVYSLHFLIVAIALTLMAQLGEWGTTASDWNPEKSRLLVLLALVLGLGMTNHVTTLFLLPPALLTLYFAGYHKQFTIRHSPFTFHNFLLPLFAGLLPLSLYAYLPIRWRAVNQEPMGAGRFFDWIVGGRFQGALQWRAWLDDPTRYEVVGRLFWENWGWFNLTVAAIGLLVLLYRERKTAVLLLLIFASYTFYCLNYYVPDLAVFLIPAQVVVGIFWGIAIKTGLERADWRFNLKAWRMAPGTGLYLFPIFLLLFLISPLTQTVANWRTMDQSVDDGRIRWGTAVLAQPLSPNSAILADSDKFPPLYYLQQSEAIRPDLDISVWPDEAAYREQLNGRLTNGQTVYLARFLPGLESAFHLNSVGPLIHVGTAPQTSLPPSATPHSLSFGEIELVGFTLQPIAETNAHATAVTFYWQAKTAVSTVQHIYVRWDGFSATAGQHPANNFYPTVAWKANEIVSDYHEFPYPLVANAQQVELQVAMGAPFSSADELTWQTVTAVTLQPNLPEPTALIRARLGNFAIDGLYAPNQTRPGTPITAVVSGWGNGDQTRIALSPKLSNAPPSPIVGPFLGQEISQREVIVRTFANVEENGRYHIVASNQQGQSCGWLQPLAADCSLGTIRVDGVALPEGAINYEDKIALLNVAFEQTELTPGERLALTLNWQALAPLQENYTVFVQLLTQDDQIVEQIDSWPLQGTYPTSQWQTGETITDPYSIQLPADLPPGIYKIQVGFYLLETLRRLPTVDENGRVTNDYFLIDGLFVPE